jgi:hypothetical protein
VYEFSLKYPVLQLLLLLLLLLLLPPPHPQQLPFVNFFTASIAGS